MKNHPDAIGVLKEAMTQYERSLDMIITAEIQRGNPEIVFGLLLNARLALTQVKANIEKAIDILNSDDPNTPNVIERACEK